MSERQKLLDRQMLSRRTLEDARLIDGTNRDNDAAIARDGSKDANYFLLPVSGPTSYYHPARYLDAYNFHNDSINYTNQVASQKSNYGHAHSAYCAYTQSYYPTTGG